MKLFGDSHHEPNYGGGETGAVDPLIEKADELLEQIDPENAPAEEIPTEETPVEEAPVEEAPAEEPDPIQKVFLEAEALDPIEKVILAEEAARNAERKPEIIDSVPEQVPETETETDKSAKKFKKSMRAIRIAALIVAGLVLVAALAVGGGYLWLRNFAEPPEPMSPITPPPVPTQPASPTQEPEPGTIVLDPTKQPPEPTEPATPTEPVEPVTPEPEPEPEPEPVQPATDPAGQHEFYTVLLAGIDYDATRTDTIMVLSIDATTHEAALMSIPRDTHAISYRGDERINAFYGFYVNGTKEGRIAGMEALMIEVGKILGYQPTGYAMVNLRAFVQLVDLIGGVDFNVPQDMDYEDPTQELYIHLQKGYQHLDGNHAMQLVRFRGYPEADIRRTQVQQQFLSAVAKQCLSLSSLTKIKDYCRIFEENVTTCFSYENLVYLAMELAECDLSAAKTYTLPGESQIINDVDYWVLYKNQTQAIIDESFNPYKVG